METKTKRDCSNCRMSEVRCANLICTKCLEGQDQWKPKDELDEVKGLGEN